MTIRLILTITLSGLIACSGAPTPPAEDANLVSVLKTRSNLTWFAELLESSGVASMLLPSGSYTIFAPMDNAVTGPLDEATIRHHILPVRVTFSDIAGEDTSYETLKKDRMEVDFTEQIAVGSGLMVESDIQASNGIIHVIDEGK